MRDPIDPQITAQVTGKLSDTLANLEQARQAEIKHPDTVPDALADSVNELREYVCRTFTDLAKGIDADRQSIDPYPDSYFREFLNPAGQWTKALAERCRQLSDEKDVDNNADAWSSMEGWLRSIARSASKRLVPCIAALRAAKALRDPPDLESIDAVWNKLLDIQQSAQEALDSLRDKETERVIKKSQEGFAKRAKEHGELSRYWFIGFVVSLLFAIVILSCTAVFSPTADATDSVHLFLLRGFLLSIPLIVTKVSLTKFNQERNLSVVYLHRATVLERYGDIVNSTLVQGSSTRDQIMLEIARLIFSDPVTGFAKNSAEINFHPVLQSAEKLLRTAS